MFVCSLFLLGILSRWTLFELPSIMSFLHRLNPTILWTSRSEISNLWILRVVKRLCWLRRGHREFGSRKVQHQHQECAVLCTKLYIANSMCNSIDILSNNSTIHFYVELVTCEHRGHLAGTISHYTKKQNIFTASNGSSITQDIIHQTANEIFSPPNGFQPPDSISSIQNCPQGPRKKNPEKLLKPNREGSSSSPINFSGANWKTLPETNMTSHLNSWMVGRLSRFLVGFSAYFQVRLLLVLGSVKHGEFARFLRTCILRLCRSQALSRKALVSPWVKANEKWPHVYNPGWHQSPLGEKDCIFNSINILLNLDPIFWSHHHLDTCLLTNLQPK